MECHQLPSEGHKQAEAWRWADTILSVAGASSLETPWMLPSFSIMEGEPGLLMGLGSQLGPHLSPGSATFSAV